MEKLDLTYVGARIKQARLNANKRSCLQWQKQCWRKNHNAKPQKGKKGNESGQNPFPSLLIFIFLFQELIKLFQQNQTVPSSLLLLP